MAYNSATAQMVKISQITADLEKKLNKASKTIEKMTIEKCEPFPLKTATFPLKSKIKKPSDLGTRPFLSGDILELNPSHWVQ